MPEEGRRGVVADPPPHVGDGVRTVADDGVDVRYVPPVAAADAAAAPVQEEEGDVVVGAPLAHLPQPAEPVSGQGHEAVAGLEPEPATEPVTG